jgi:hypothetical protein
MVAASAISLFLYSVTNTSAPLLYYVVKQKVITVTRNCSPCKYKIIQKEGFHQVSSLGNLFHCHSLHTYFHFILEAIKQLQTSSSVDVFRDKEAQTLSPP